MCMRVSSVWCECTTQTYTHIYIYTYENKATDLHIFCQLLDMFMNASSSLPLPICIPTEQTTGLPHSHTNKNKIVLLLLCM